MSDLFSLNGKIAAVSGCTRGIGRGMALGLADAGAGNNIISFIYKTKD